MRDSGGRRESEAKEPEGDAGLSRVGQPLGVAGGLVLREPAVPDPVRVVRPAIRGFAERNGASQTLQPSVALAITEACANVIVLGPAGVRSRERRRL